MATSPKVYVFHHFLFMLSFCGDEGALSFYCSSKQDCSICFSFATEQVLARVEKLRELEFALSLNSEAH